MSFYHFPYEKVTQEVSLFFSGTKKRNTSKIQFDEKNKQKQTAGKEPPCGNATVTNVLFYFYFTCIHFIMSNKLSKSEVLLCYKVL